MNIKRPPPLQWLPVFEAAARLSSFKRAAAELFVTPPAVSQQIKLLENHLGLTLFHRRARAIELTDAGAFYREVVAELLAQHRRGHSQLVRKFGASILRANTIPFVAFELLIPNLERFKQRHPDVDLRIETSMSLVDFEHEPVDVALRFGSGRWPGLIGQPLGRAAIAPVGSPALFAKKPLRELDDLRHHRLIHLHTDRDDWAAVFKYIGVEMPEPEEELVFDGMLAAMTAAERGLGVALGVFPLISAWIESGRLAAPIGTLWPIPQRYYLVYREEDADNALIGAFCKWTRELFAELPDLREMRARHATT